MTFSLPTIRALVKNIGQKQEFKDLVTALITLAEETEKQSQEIKRLRLEVAGLKVAPNR